MVRQDKLYYLVHELRAWRSPGSLEKDSVLHSVIDAILHQQSTCSVTTNSIFSHILSKCGSIDNIRAADPRKLMKLDIPIKLQLQNAQSIINFLDWSKKKFGGYDLEEMMEWDDQRISSELLSIDGIDQDTVDLVLCLYLDRDVFPVDSDIFRAIKRFGIVGADQSQSQASTDIGPFVPIGAHRGFYVSLKDFASRVCMAIKPVCGSCIVSSHCSYHNASEVVYG